MSETRLTHKPANAILLRKNYDANNLAAAQIIIRDTQKWGGPGAGLVQWAWLVLGRLQPQQNLFRGAA